MREGDWLEDKVFVQILVEPAWQDEAEDGVPKEDCHEDENKLPRSSAEGRESKRDGSRACH